MRFLFLHQARMDYFLATRNDIGGDANLVLETMALALGRDIFSFQLVDGILETGYLVIGFQARRS
jgi:hypothetical protein